MEIEAKKRKEQKEIQLKQLVMKDTKYKIEMLFKREDEFMEESQKLYPGYWIYSKNDTENRSYVEGYIIDLGYEIAKGKEKDKIIKKIVKLGLEKEKNLEKDCIIFTFPQEEKE